MCARLAYPNGEAREDEMLTRTRGKMIFWVGKIDGTLALLGVEK